MTIKKSNLLKKTKGDKEFLTMNNLLTLWMRQFYGLGYAVIIYQCQIAFDSLPMLTILKRDDLKSYLKAMESDFAIFQFDTEDKANDFVFSLGSHNGIVWSMYVFGELYLESE